MAVTAINSGHPPQYPNVLNEDRQELQSETSQPNAAGTAQVEAKAAKAVGTPFAEASQDHAGRERLSRRSSGRKTDKKLNVFA